MSGSTPPLTIDSPDPARRRFLQIAGTGLVAAPLAGSLLGAPSSPADAAQQSQRAAMPPASVTGRPMPQIQKPFPLPPQSRIGFAVVGLGKFALNQIIPSFAESKRSKLVALVSGNREKAEQVAGRYGVDKKAIYDYASFDSLAGNAEVDVVYIILPNGLHAEYAIRAAKAGKHVMCEKPMASTVAECEAMIRASLRAGRKLMVAYRAQYEPFNLEAIRLAHSGDLGKLKLVVSDHGRNLNPSDPADQWRMSAKLAGGGALYDIGIYSLQAARYITGEEPEEIHAMIHSTRGDPRFREVEENVTFQLRFPSGVLANCSASYGYADTKRITVQGSEASLTLDPATDYYEHKLTITKGKTEERIKLQEGNQFALEMDHFAQSIQEDQPPRTPGEEGLQDVRLMQAIYEAARTGRTVKLEPRIPDVVADVP
jgi:glucose-fructose oxidoreductase